MKRIQTVLLAAVGIVAVSSVPAFTARDQIRIAGSSTVFPFSTVVAERFGQSSDFSTPVVESIGSSGGLKEFCRGVGEEFIDIANASRKIKKNEVEICKANGVTPIEVVIGFDGIVLANAKQGAQLSLTLEQVYRAVAKQVPDADGKLIDNPYTNWSDIDPSLPNAKIEVLGPPPTSGTRDAFEELGLEKGGCKDAGVSQDDCGKVEIREDGAYIDAGENDNLIVSKLVENPSAVGIFGFSFLDQNGDRIQGAVINGFAPEFDNIASGDYKLSRSLQFYIKQQHIGVIPGLKEFAAEFVSDNAIGEEGYLPEIGLIPLSQDSQKSNLETVSAL